MTVHSPGSVFCRSNDLGMDFCWVQFRQFFRDFGGAQKYTLISDGFWKKSSTNRSGVGILVKSNLGKGD
jgi:hypothetical protein